VFEGVETLLVRLEGDDGVAARAFLEEAPRPGFTREILLEAERAVPIVGVVRPAEGAALPPAPPPLVGHVDVAEVLPRGAVPHRSAVVAPDGSFVVSYAAKGAWRLEAHLGFYEDPPAATADPTGASPTVLDTPRPLPWLVLDPPARDAEVTLEAPHGPVPTRRHGVLLHEGRVLVAVPGPGRYGVRVATPGDADRPPSGMRGEVEVLGVGPHEVTLEPEEVPHGDLVLTLPDGPGAGGALEVLGRWPRRATFLPGLASRVAVRNLLAGPVTARVVWRDEGTAWEWLGADVPAGGVAEAVAKRVPGGRVAVLPSALPGSEGGEALLLSWAEGSSPYGREGETRVAWRHAAGRFESEAALLPGRYEATLASPRGDAVLVAFEVEALQTVVVGAP
jgi:hypothetical protein